jgi:hypothetical protein
VVLIYVVRTFARNWSDLKGTQITWTIRPALVIASALLTWTIYVGLIATWRYLLLAWKQRIDALGAARIWTVSNLGKYVPGKMWAIAGMAIMAQQQGVAPWAATGSAIILQFLAIGTGVAMTAFTGTTVLETAYPGARWALLALGLVSLAGVCLVLIPSVASRLLALFARRDQAPPPPLPVRAILVGVGMNLVAWAGYGVSLWLLAKGLLPVAHLDVLTAVGAFAASYLAGFLFLLAPGGLGVREGILILMLQRPLGLGTATALALASRVLLTVTEVGAAVPFLLFSRTRTRDSR